jgi:hypothetical protein
VRHQGLQATVYRGCWRCLDSGRVILPREGYCWCERGARVKKADALLTLRLALLLILAIVVGVTLHHAF